MHHHGERQGGGLGGAPLNHPQHYGGHVVGLDSMEGLVWVSGIVLRCEWSLLGDVKLQYNQRQKYQTMSGCCTIHVIYIWNKILAMKSNSWSNKEVIRYYHIIIFLV